MSVGSERSALRASEVCYVVESHPKSAAGAPQGALTANRRKARR